MRHIDFAEPPDATWKDWRSRCSKACQDLIDAIFRGRKPNINKDLYKEQKVTVYMSYKREFRGKCAYCERDIHNQYGDTEHYRPKDSVTDIKRKRVVRRQNGATECHPGYYWLTDEWTNLLPACERCNSPSRQFTEGRLVGKWDRFPVAGERAWEPGEEENEEPLLLNPVVDEPSDHLVFDPTGVIGAKNNDVRGQTTIDVLGLNDDGLPGRRLEKYQDVRDQMKLFIRAYSMDKDSKETIRLRKRLEPIKKGHGEFTTYATMAIEHEYQDYLDKNELPRGKPRGIKISVLSFLSQQAAGN